MLKFLRTLSAIMDIVVKMMRIAEKRKKEAAEKERQARIEDAKDDPVKSFDAMFNAGKDGHELVKKSKED